MIPEEVCVFTELWCCLGAVSKWSVLRGLQMPKMQQQFLESVIGLLTEVEFTGDCATGNLL